MKKDLNNDLIVKTQSALNKAFKIKSNFDAVVDKCVDAKDYTELTIIVVSKGVLLYKTAIELFITKPNKSVYITTIHSVNRENYVLLTFNDLMLVKTTIEGVL